MTRIQLISIASTVSIFVAGCDTIGGISHVKRETSLPGNSCIINAVQSVQGVSDVEYRTESGGRPLTLHGIEKPDEVHRYIYRYSGLMGNFYYRVNYKGDVEYHHTYFDINRVPPQSEIDNIRPIMFEIEKTIETKCNLNDFVSGIEEKCSGVKCE